MTTTKFEIDLNLDDEVEMKWFLSMHEPLRGQVLANRLGFKGKGSVRAASALMNYAQNRRAAATCRRLGQIATALEYERICDRIYREDIQPKITCW